MEDSVALIKKTGEPHQRMVWAEVYAPNKPDSDGEYMTAETIRKMAYAYSRKLALNQVDHEHNNELTDGVCIVETFVARKGDPDFIEGAWVVGCHIDNDEKWDKVLKGEINGFSVEAMVMREERDVELDMPPVITGLTTKSEGHGEHEHKFYISYDETGKFRGGVTDAVDGHSHVIKAGTRTESANDHTHRFSAVDQIQFVIEG